MTRIRRYLNNGGMKDIIEMGIQFLVYIVLLSFVIGRTYSGYNELRNRVEKIETTKDCLEDIKIRLKAVEENQARILEILQGKYNR